MPCTVPKIIWISTLKAEPVPAGADATGTETWHIPLHLRQPWQARFFSRDSDYIWDSHTLESFGVLYSSLKIPEPTCSLLFFKDSRAHLFSPNVDVWNWEKGGWFLDVLIVISEDLFTTKFNIHSEAFELTSFRNQILFSVINHAGLQKNSKFQKTENVDHRRRIKTEEKGKVRHCCLFDRFIQLLAALAI